LAAGIRRFTSAIVASSTITADEAVNNLPAGPTGRYKRTLARLYSLVGQTAGRATTVLELGEELVDLHEAIKS
jgi:hypothetical protein